MTPRNPKWKRRRRVIRWVFALLAFGVVGLVVRGSVVGLYNVTKASEAPTLVIGDRVYFNLAAYDLRVPFTDSSLYSWGSPAAGDMVLCRLPDREGLYMKRVLAVGGDSVQLQRNRLSVGGVSATYRTIDPADLNVDLHANRTGDRFAVEQFGANQYLISYNAADTAVANFGPQKVPEGHYFLVGDNRDNSYDSRTDTCGYIARNAILARMIGKGRRPPSSPPTP